MDKYNLFAVEIGEYFALEARRKDLLAQAQELKQQQDELERQFITYLLESGRKKLRINPRHFEDGCERCFYVKHRKSAPALNEDTLDDAAQEYFAVTSTIARRSPAEEAAQFTQYVDRLREAKATEKTTLHIRKCV